MQHGTWYTYERRQKHQHFKENSFFGAKKKDYNRAKLCLTNLLDSYVMMSSLVNVIYIDFQQSFVSSVAAMKYYLSGKSEGM